MHSNNHHLLIVVKLQQVINDDCYYESYIDAMKQELNEYGLLKDSEYICNTCNNSLSKKAPEIPTRALVNGHFRGKCPKELECLSRVEESMVSLINVFTKVHMLPKGGHYASKGTIFSLLNDFNELQENLPCCPTNSYSILKPKGSTNNEYQYSPSKVKAALIWLHHNNHLYKDKINFKSNLLKGEDFIEIEALEFEEEDDDDELFKSIEIPTNSGAPEEIKDILLDVPETSKDFLSQLKIIFNIKNNSSIQSNSGNVFRREMQQYVMDYNIDDFLPMAFIKLYPYGKGCPIKGGGYKLFEKSQ